ncbi:MAG: copper amine oxidase N-terminal domain-containing protein [Bacillota bacterium]
MKKKYGALLALSIAMVFTTGFTTRPDVEVFINEELVIFDVLPIIENGSVLVPMRGIFESLSCEVIWEEETQKIMAHTAQNKEVVLHIGNDELYLDGELVYTMPVLPKIIDGRTLVPLRAVSESLGCEVSWDGDTYTVSIVSQEAMPTSSLGTNTTHTMSNDIFHAKMFEQGEVILEIIIDLNSTIGYLPSIKTALVAEAETVAKDFFAEYRAEALENYNAQHGVSDEEVVEEDTEEENTNFLPIVVTGKFEKMFSDGAYASFLFQGKHNEVSSGEKEWSGITLDLSTYEKIEAHQLFLGASATDLYTLHRLALENIIANDKKKVINATAMNRFEILKTKIDFYIDEDENVNFFFPEKTIGDVDLGIVSFSLPLAIS